LQQFPGSASWQSILVVKLVAAERHHGTDNTALDHSVEITMPGFPYGAKWHRQKIAGRRALDYLVGRLGDRLRHGIDGRW
jgi:hypothetical protein